jgi:hypothetical protein
MFNPLGLTVQLIAVFYLAASLLKEVCIQL